MSKGERLWSPVQRPRKMLRSFAAVGLAGSSMLVPIGELQPDCRPREGRPSASATYLPEMTGFDAERLSVDEFRAALGALGLRLDYRPASDFTPTLERPSVAELQAGPGVRSAVMEGLRPFSKEFLHTIGVRTITITALGGTTASGEPYAGYNNFHGTIGLDYRLVTPTVVRHEVGHSFDAASCGGRLQTEDDPLFAGHNPDGAAFYRRPSIPSDAIFQSGTVRTAGRAHPRQRSAVEGALVLPLPQPHAIVANHYVKDRVDEDKAGVFAIATAPELVVCETDKSPFVDKVAEVRERLAMLDETQAEHIDRITQDC